MPRLQAELRDPTSQLQQLQNPFFFNWGTWSHRVLEPAMASLNLGPEDLQTLEALRQRLQNVSTSLLTFRHSLNEKQFGVLPSR
jgi:hypothetical protein